jgi:hypothetical protein
MFVAALDRADRESGRALLAKVSEEHVYEASLSLMMRLVFLFFAEERDPRRKSEPLCTVESSFFALLAQPD